MKPKPELPASFHEQPPSAAQTAQAAEAIRRWWTMFQDPLLDSLIDRAVASNKDLKVAQARVREARAQARVTSAGLFPTVDTSASYTRSLRSENATSSGSSGGSSSSSRSSGTSTTGTSPQDLFQAGFDASWELDIFGGVRRSIEAANADTQSFIEAQRNTLVTLLSEVARNYLQLRGDQQRLALARSNIEVQRQTVELSRARFEAGLGSELEVEQAKTQLASTEASVPAIEISIKQSIHQLGVLLGKEPGALSEELSAEAPLPPVPPEIPVGLPSDLLRRRPDVRQAERQIEAATARIGVATADLFPKFSLTGNTGLQSVELSDLFTPESHFWSFGPSVRWPIFDAGRIRANIQVQDARQEQALAQYEKTVLTALQDVENALVAYDQEQVARRALLQATASSQRAAEISRTLYSTGLSDFLNVLVSERSLYQTQDQLAQSESRVATDLVALFKALGGGWDVPAE